MKKGAENLSKGLKKPFISIYQLGTFSQGCGRVLGKGVVGSDHVVKVKKLKLKKM